MHRESFRVQTLMTHPTGSSSSSGAMPRSPSSLCARTSGNTPPRRSTRARWVPVYLVDAEDGFVPKHPFGLGIAVYRPQLRGLGHYRGRSEEDRSGAQGEGEPGGASKGGTTRDLSVRSPLLLYRTAVQTPAPRLTAYSQETGTGASELQEGAGQVEREISPQGER